MSITPLSFTGVSQFSADFQSILNRAVAIANLPVKGLENQQANLLSKKQLLTGLNGAVDSLGSSISALKTVAQNKGLVATSSDITKVVINSTNASTPATYAITNITSLAKTASESSVIGYATANATAVSSTRSLSLVIGSNNYPITLTPATNNLTGLRDAINALGVGATASVLTTGTGPTPNYLSISANTSGSTTLQLFDDPTGANTNLLTAANQGANAVFQLNGVNVSKTSNIINDVINGVSFTIAGTSVAGATISLASDRSQLSNALQSLVSAYNALGGQVNGQIGPNAGLLSGDLVVRSIQNGLRQVVHFQGAGGAIKNLGNLGIELSNAGQMSLNQATFNSLSANQISDAFSFLGSAGFGALSGALSQISDPVSGLIKTQQDQYTTSDKRISSQIGALTLRINQMQTSLSAKLQKADALLATLQSQQNVLTSSIQSLSTVSFGKQQGNSF